MAMAPEPWAQTATGWHRPMLGAEIVFAAFSTHSSGQGHGSLSTEATFSPPASLSNAMSDNEMASLFRSAWVDVRYNLHPLLAAVSAAPVDVLDIAGYSLFYPLVDTGSASRWAEETVFQHPPTTMLDLVASLKDMAPTARSSRATLHFAHSTTEDAIHVVLVTGHWITDGLGSFAILDRIVQYLNEPSARVHTWGNEVERLSIPLAIATGRRIAQSGQLVPLPQSHVDKVLGAMMGGVGAMEPSYTQPSGTHELPQTKPDVIRELSLSVHDTNALLDLCRSHGVTVTSLFSALLALVFVGDDSSISDFKTVQFPFFSINRGADLLDEYKSSVGLQLTLSPFAFDAVAIRKCLESGDCSSESQIWSLAAAAKAQLVAAKTDEVPLVFEHEIVCAILPHLLSSGGDALFRTAVPFLTSVGRITPLVPQSASASASTVANDRDKENETGWKVVNVANSFTLRWFRPVIHIWEWQGITTVRIVATGEYDDLHSVERMRDDMGLYVRRLLES